MSGSARNERGTLAPGKLGRSEGAAQGLKRLGPLLKRAMGLEQEDDGLLPLSTLSGPIRNAGKWTKINTYSWKSLCPSWAALQLQTAGTPQAGSCTTPGRLPRWGPSHCLLPEPSAPCH